MTKRKDPKDLKKAGRPTKYNPKLCEDLIKFFDRPLYIKKKLRKWIDGKEEIIESEVPNKTPFLIRWTQKHKISHGTPWVWAKEHPEFLDALNRSKALLEAFLVELGIKGDHNGFMTNQTLKNVCGWRDKIETENTTKVETSHTVTIKFEEMSEEQLTDFILKRRNSYQQNTN